MERSSEWAKSSTRVVGAFPSKSSSTSMAGGCARVLVARFSVETGEPQMVIRVPLEGVFERFGSQHVYVIEDGIALRRAIVLGSVGAGFAEITEGIEPGDTVVIKGVNRVVDGSKVLVVPVDSSTEQTGEP